MIASPKHRKATKPDKTSSKASAPDSAAAMTVELPIGTIDARPYNPRTDFDQEELERLASSLKTHGLLQPIVVRVSESGSYELIAGGRRLRAAELAGWKTIPATAPRSPCGCWPKSNRVPASRSSCAPSMNWLRHSGRGAWRRER